MAASTASLITKLEDLHQRLHGALQALPDGELGYLERWLEIHDKCLFEGRGREACVKEADNQTYELEATILDLQTKYEELRCFGGKGKVEEADSISR